MRLGRTVLRHCERLCGLLHATRGGGLGLVRAAARRPVLERLLRGGGLGEFRARLREDLVLVRCDGLGRSMLKNDDRVKASLVLLYGVRRVRERQSEEVHLLRGVARLDRRANLLFACASEERTEFLSGAGYLLNLLNELSSLASRERLPHEGDLLS